jgi:hypothetical protein
MASTIGKKIANWTVGNSIGARSGTLRRALARSARTSLLGGVCTLALAVTAWQAGPAVAGCGSPVRARAAHRSHHVPLVLGDSVMIFAVPPLARLGFDADARGCRQMPEAMAILRARKRAGTLPHLVVLALGTNGFVTRADIHAVLHLLGRHRVLAMVTPRELGGGASSDAANIRLAARRHPQRMRVIDWVRYSTRHGSLFGGADGIHITPAGGRLFARLIAHTVHRDAAPPRPKRR